MSNRFIRGVHGVLNSALEQAVKERLITSNPAEGCKLPKIEKKEMKVLLPEQIGAISRKPTSAASFQRTTWN